MSSSHVLKMAKEFDAQFIDLRFTNTHGKELHVTVPVSQLDEELLEHGKMFDGSSIAGWKHIHASDMILLPDPTTAVLDPFMEESTINLRCDVIEPTTMQPYDRDPRSIAKRAEQYLKSTGIADTAFFGPEPEFFIFDDVRWHIDLNTAGYAIDSREGCWNSGSSFEDGNMGHRPSLKGGYFPVPPVDSAQDLRSSICITLEEMGIIVEAHHHEVATAGQHEVATRFNSLVRKADETQILKYVVQNVAHQYGKTATFMPKPIVGDNGSGMHCHQSLSKGGQNLFSGDRYAGLSETALYYIGGIIRHAKALNALTNGTTNSYKRLVPGFEAPVMLAYSACNRSAAIRIPHCAAPKGRRIEVRFPDACANPYLAFSAMLLAGLDGIKNKILPGDPMDHDLYELSPAQTREIPTVCGSLDEALIALDQDRRFLTESKVFSDEFLNSYIHLKEAEITRLRMTTHPVEFEMYYS